MRRAPLIGTACISLAILSGTARAQAASATLSGRVSSAKGGSPVAGAELIAAGTRHAESDSVGVFVLRELQPGAVRIQVRAMGFAPLDTAIVLGVGGTETTLVMSPNAVVLAPVITEAVLPYGKPLRYQHTSKFDAFYERRAKRPGTFFTREDIERSGRSSVFELMSSAPGVIVGTRPGGIPYVRISRCVGNSIRVDDRRDAYKWLALYIDGQRIRGATGADVLEYLSQLKAGDVETVEVYRGVTQLPMEAIGDACAAVFVTTRYTAGSVLNR